MQYSHLMYYQRVAELIESARYRVEHQLPKDANFNDVVESAYKNILDAVSERVQYAIESAMLGAQSSLGSRAEEYIQALKVDDDLSINIEESARHLEEGYSSYEMLPRLASGPSSKTANDGSRYTTVPIGKTKKSDIKAAIIMKASDLLKDGSLRATGSFNLQFAETLKMSKGSVSEKPASGFATASTKQDSSKSWVNPGFSGVKQLSFINQSLQVDLLDTVTRILEQETRRHR